MVEEHEFFHLTHHESEQIFGSSPYLEASSVNTMAKKTRKPLGRRYLTSYYLAGTATASHYKQLRSFFDLKGILDTLAGQGEEVKISKAILRVAANASDPFALQPAILVSDAAISDVAGGGTTQGGNIDDDLDAMTSGDFEMMNLADSMISRGNPDGADQGVSVLNFSKDITEQVRRASAMLIKSALLATNPEVELVCLQEGATTAQAINVFATLQLDYQLVAKPLRMLV